MLYAAPEQTREETEIDSRSDIFNLGSLLYALLTGRPPFEGGSPEETLEKVRTALPVKPKEYHSAIPDGLQAVVLQMLAKHPEAIPWFSLGNEVDVVIDDTLYVIRGE